jgi:hypothetical protein
MYHYYLGLDLGQQQDYTALTLVEEPIWCGQGEIDWDYFSIFMPDGVEGWTSPSRLPPRLAARVLKVIWKYGRPAHPPLYVRELWRWPLRTKHTQIIQEVRQLLLREPFVKRLDYTRLLIDRTGVGAGVVDSFEQAGVRPISVTIHGGSNVSCEGRHYRVPKRDLVSAAQVLLQNGRLRIAPELELASVLTKELLNFRVKIDPKTAHDSYEHWREGDHDDLVLATALACWYREYVNAHLEVRNTRQEGFRIRERSHSDLDEYAVYPNS